MKTFKDDAGRNWTIALNVHVLKRVRDLARTDLLALDEGSPPLVIRLQTDVILLCDVLFAILKPDADEMEPPVNDEEFARGLGGDGLALASAALSEELRDFFQRLGRNDLSRVIAARAELVKRVVERQGEKVDALDLDDLIDRAEQSSQPNPPSRSTPGEPSTSSPGSSESSQALTPSES